MRTISVDEAFHQVFQVLADRHKLTDKEFAQAMITCFERTGLDPRDVDVKTTAAAIKELDKRLISFMRTQESTMLKPLLEELGDIAKKLRGFLDDYAKEDTQTAIKTILDELKGKYEDANKELRSIRTAISNMKTEVAEVEKLKGQLQEMNKLQGQMKAVIEDKLSKKILW